MRRNESYEVLQVTLLRTPAAFLKWENYMSAGSEDIRNLAADYWLKSPSPMGIYDYSDGKLKVVCRNDCFYELLCGDEKNCAAYQEHKMEMVHPDDRQRLSGELEASLRERRRSEIQIRLRTGDGCYHWFGVSGSHEYVSEAAARFYLAFFSVDELVSARERLQADQKILNLAMKNADMLYFVYYPEQKRYENLMIPDSLSRLPAGMDNYPECVIEDRAMNPVDAAKYHDMVWRIDEGAPEAGCVVQMRYEGQYKWMEVKLFNVADESGGQRIAAGFATDISEYISTSKRLREEMQSAAAMSTDILGSGYVNVTRDRTDTMAYRQESGMSSQQSYEPWILEEALLVDPRIARQSEETRALLLSAAQTIVDSDKRAEYIRRLDHFGLLAEYEAGHEEFTIEYRRRIDDEIVWVSTRTVFRTNPETGDLIAFFYLRDINRQKLLERVYDLSFTVDSDYSAILDVGKKTVSFVKLNDFYTNIVAKVGGKEWEPLDYEMILRNHLCSVGVREEREEIYEETKLSSIIEAVDREKRYTLVCSVVEGGKLRKKQLTCFWLDDLMQKIVVTQNDVTATYEKEKYQIEKLAEALGRAEAANQAKSDFLSRMSHDIRTPMNAIIGFSTLLQRDAHDPEKVLDESGKILSSSRHLLGLINDILDMSKIESGKMQINNHVFSFSDMLDSIDTMMRTQMNQKEQRFEISADTLAHDLYYADENRLQQVLINLLSNAHKYTPAGGTVQMQVVSGEKRPGNFDDITIRISDNGRGMTKEFLEKIFEPFTRETLDARDKTQGTGLGMSITRNLVELMGGTIRVESELGQGSTFFIELPMKVSEHDADASKKMTESHSGVSEEATGGGKDTDVLNGLHILAAEDNELNAEILQELLRMNGAEVIVEPDGQKAFEKFCVMEPGSIDLILMDVIMPVMDGYEATRAIRALPGSADASISDEKKKEAAKIPIIAMTANAFADDVRKALECGMNAHAAKPLNIESFKNKVREVLNR